MRKELIHFAKMGVIEIMPGSLNTGYDGSGINPYELGGATGLPTNAPEPINIVPQDPINNTGVVPPDLDGTNQDLDPVIVTGSYNTKKIAIALAVAAGVVMLNKKKKGNRKKIGAVKKSGSSFNTPYGGGSLSPKLETVVVVGVIGFAIFNFSQIKKLFEGIGFWKSEDEKQAEAISANPYSYWNPLFWQNAPKGSLLLTNASADNLLNQIDDSWGVFSDDEGSAIAAIKSLRTQSQISYLSYRFTQNTGKDFVTYLFQDNWPDDHLSSAEFADLAKFTDKLPKYN